MSVSFYEYNRLGSLLKKGETEFTLIDRIPRRLHDTMIGMSFVSHPSALNNQAIFRLFPTAVLQ